jgi:bifunctional non-homologous end joining protein LigD
MLPQISPSPITSLKEPIGHPNWVYELKHDGFRVKGKLAILDGEIVVLDEKGRSNFFELMAHRGEPRYYAFDLVWLNGRDLRSQPLLERKRRLHRLIPPNDSHLLYEEYLEGDGARFFELVCEQDLEGIICKPKTSPYPFTWIKVKNPNYSQAVGRGEMFDCLLAPER